MSNEAIPVRFRTEVRPDLVGADHVDGSGLSQVHGGGAGFVQFPGARARRAHVS